MGQEAVEGEPRETNEEKVTQSGEEGAAGLEQGGGGGESMSVDSRRCLGVSPQGLSNGVGGAGDEAGMAPRFLA